jgi:regulatory protein
LEIYPTKKTKWTKDVALTELKRWCAADEKCHSQVRTKLIEHHIYGDDLEYIISELISENFLNETRYAVAYASGKFKINGWGKIKIKQGLISKQISSYNINKALNSIDPEEYMTVLKKLLVEKQKSTNTSTLQGKQKMVNFLLQRGFEQNLISNLLYQKEDF